MAKQYGEFKTVLRFASVGICFPKVDSFLLEKPKRVLQKSRAPRKTGRRDEASGGTSGVKIRVLGF